MIDANTWPGGHRHAMHQGDHEAWNAGNYPGTLQMCSLCDEPTFRCEDDELLRNGQPICEDCYQKEPGDK